MKILPALAVLILLTGCRATFWAQPPLPAGACDPAVQGRWYSEIEYPEEGESQQLRLDIDAGCRVVATAIVGRAIGESSEPARIGIARHQGQTYAWLDANTLLAYNGQAHRTRAGDVMVFRYRVEGGRLWVWNVNHVHARSLINSGAVAGEFNDTEFDEFNRFTGSVAPSQLAAPEFFDGPATVLTRTDGRQ